MKSRHVEYTGRAWQRHREFWEGRVLECGGHAAALMPVQGGVRVPHAIDDLGRVAVILAALARVYGSLTSAQSFVIDTPPLASGSGDDAVPMILPIPSDGTVGELLRDVTNIVSQSYTFQAFPVRRVLACPPANVLLVCRAIHREIPRDGYDVVIDIDEALPEYVRNVLAAFDDTSQRIADIDIVGATNLFTLFEQTALRFPDRIAVESPSRAVTYAELLRDTRTLRVRSGEVVAVKTERTIEWITELLGVLAGGAAYLPIDPHLPEARIRRYMEETGATVIPSVVEGPGWVCGAPPAPPGPSTSLGMTAGLAYIIYTSGSTGDPKGVMIEHAGFINMILDQIRVFGIDETDRVLQLASASFDASLSEIFMTLLSGAALVLIDEETIADASAFTRYVDEKRVTAMTVTPLYLSALERHPLPSVRTMIVAGDVARVDTTLHYARTKRVFNAYGPTEVSVCATMHLVDPEESVIPIGTPVANCDVYIVDRYGRRVPRGVSGELWFAGPGVARGYVGRNDPAFIDDPFMPGRRCYRTGDRGRQREDGAILFEGRIDEQLKIRGYRIEPAEIEQALLRHPSVAEAHVAAVEIAEHRELVAWVSTRDAIELWPSVAEFFVYDDVVYGAMAADEKRNRAYRAAAERHVRGKVVFEIGPGPEAVLSRICVEAGARKVYAIELSREVAERARARVEALGLSERIEIIHGDAAEVVLPELADLCFSEIVGAIGGSEGAALIINRSRHLLRDPRAQIPARSITKIAGVSLEGRELDLRFPAIAAHYVERIFAENGGPFDLRLCLKNLPSDAIVTTADVFEDLDFRDDVPLEDEHRISLRVTRDTTLDGFLVWLHLIVDDQNTVDILDSTGSWLPVFLPIEPRAVRAGEVIHATIRRRLSVNGRNPDFFIDGLVDAFHVAPGFRRTPFYGRLFADGAIPSRPDASAAGLRQFAAELLPPYMVPAHIELVDRLPMNRSGKVDRKALPAPRWSGGNRDAARNEAEAAVIDVWQEVLGRAPLGIHDDFFVIGGDSIRAIQIASRLAQRGLHVTTRDILENPTPAALAQKVRVDVARASQETIEGPLPLTPIQSWFFDHIRTDPHHFNQALMFRFDGRFDMGALTRALEQVIAHHDALRSRFVDGRATIDAPAPLPPLEIITLADVDRLQASLDLERGPIMCAAIVRMDDGDRLLWIIHHLAVDWVSWRILAGDLQAAYRGEPLPPKTESMRRWAEEVQRRDASAERAYWERVLNADAPGLPDGYQLPVTGSRQTATGNWQLTDQLTDQLDASTTALLLGEANRAYNTDVRDILLTALGRAIGVQTLVAVEGHGRDAVDLDVSRTVGWFTTFYPVLLDPARDIRQVKESLRAIPANGAGYLALRSELPPWRPQISFNYLGQFGGEMSGEWTLADESAGSSVSPRAERPCDIDFLASCIDGCLQLSITYDATRFRRDTAMRLLSGLRNAIADLVAHCVARDESEPTLSDLTYAALSQEEFDGLFTE